jgi:hypothetical protein
MKHVDTHTRLIPKMKRITLRMTAHESRNNILIQIFYFSKAKRVTQEHNY